MRMARCGKYESLFQVWDMTYLTVSKQIPPVFTYLCHWMLGGNKLWDDYSLDLITDFLKVFNTYEQKKNNNKEKLPSSALQRPGSERLGRAEGRQEERRGERRREAVESGKVAVCVRTEGRRSLQSPHSCVSVCAHCAIMMWKPFCRTGTKFSIRHCG